MVVIIRVWMYIYTCRCYDECDSCANIYVYICDVSDLYIYFLSKIESRKCVILLDRVNG